MKFSTCVLGLGNIGFLFDLDKKRKGIWSHVSAYKKSRYTDLVAAIELDSEKRKIFSSYYPKVLVFASVEAFLDSGIHVDICSVCTPSFLRKKVISQVLKIPKLKAIFCEKPLALTVQEGKEILRLCKKEKILLAVNHTRRWESIYLQARALITSGKIGNVVSVSGIYSGQIYNIGTHLVDTIRMLIDVDPISVCASSIINNTNDPDVSGVIEYDNGIICSILSTKKREDLIFEIDVIGTEGRLKVNLNGSKLQLFKFHPSLRYSGYREFEECPLRLSKGKDRFVASVDNICRKLMKKDKFVMCEGRDAFIALLTSEMLYRSAIEGKKIIRRRLL